MTHIRMPSGTYLGTFFTNSYFREPPESEVRGILLPRTRVNKGKRKDRGTEHPGPSRRRYEYSPQTRFMLTFFHVPTLVPSPAVHTNSAPAESMYTSPLVWVPVVGLPALAAGFSFSCALPPSNSPP